MRQGYRLWYLIPTPHSYAVWYLSPFYNPKSYTPDENALYVYAYVKIKNIYIQYKTTVEISKWKPNKRQKIKIFKYFLGKKCGFHVNKQSQHPPLPIILRENILEINAPVGSIDLADRPARPSSESCGSQRVVLTINSL